MALLLLKKSPHALWRICANAADLADCNYIADDYETQEISEEDFQALRVKSKMYDNDSQSIVDREAGVHAGVSTTSPGLKIYLNDIISTLDNYVTSNEGKQLATQAATYSNLLKDFVSETVGTTLESMDYSGDGGINWEQYCADNSITFLSPLQIG